MSAQLGFASISALDRPLVEAGALAARVGLDGIEVTARPPHVESIATPAEAERAGKALRAAGVEVLAYGSYLACRETAAPAEITREVAIAAALGAPRLRVWATHPAGAEDPQRAAVVDFLRATAEAAAAAGVSVVVERHDGSFADSVERCAALLDAVDHEAVSLNYQVRDLLRPSDVPRLADDVRSLIPSARYFHVKNYRPNPDASGPLLPGGSLRGGVLDYAELLGAAVAAGYAGPYTIEFLAWDARPIDEKLAEDAATLRALLAAVRPG